MIALPDAVVDPGAVVIVDANAAVADVTVLRPSGFDYLALGADLEALG
jgi:hypothetical protein